jgi:cellobiose transport system substrate-binding protein
MRLSRRRGSLSAVAATLAGVLAFATACAGDSDKKSSGGATSGTAKITLTVDDFGTFGYEDLYKQYEAAHPNVHIAERNVPKLEDYLPTLQQRIAAGAGAGDVVAIEEGIIVKFVAQADKFVDLKQYGADSLQNNFLPWKWKQGTTPDGKVIGLGTDMGSMSLCYRTDLFKKAGMPTDRAAVAQLWPSWDAFIDTGKQYTNKTGKKFIDSPDTLFNTILMQNAGASTNFTYFDQSNNFVMQSNPAVKQAFDETVKMANAKISANLQLLSPEWTQGIKKDAFAAVPCPAWMLGLVKDNAGDKQAGKWDVAQVPGQGANWGGSFLGVPAQSKHPKEAADLVKFLTSPQGQVAAFKSKNNLPSSPQAQADPAVKDFKNDYFNNAPVGQIFTTVANGLKPVYLGADNQEVRAAVEADLRAVGQGKLSGDKAWNKALSDAKKASGTG